MTSQTTTGGTFIQYGCGLSAPEGWINFDASPTLRLQRLPVVGGLAARQVRFPSSVRYGDVVRGLPLATGSVDGVYCSHVLEHLSLDDLRKALRETHRVLKPGGVFRGVLPDLKVMAEAYVADPTPQAAITFMRSTLLGYEERPRGMMGLARSVIGNSQHLWMWDYRGMEAELDAAGFLDIRPATFGDSATTAFAGVEERDRWDNALGFECRR